jgi:hypothetical protein
MASIAFAASFDSKGGSLIQDPIRMKLPPFQTLTCLLLRRPQHLQPHLRCRFRQRPMMNRKQR